MKFKVGDRVINILNKCCGEICECDPLHVPGCSKRYRIKYDNYDYDINNSDHNFESISYGNLSNWVSQHNIIIDVDYYRDIKIDTILK